MTNRNKQAYILGIDSYGTDSFGCAAVITRDTIIMAVSDRGAKLIANTTYRNSVSYILRPDGSKIWVDDIHPWSNSQYRVGC